MSFYVIDVESDGPVPGIDMYSLVSLGAVRIEGYEITDKFAMNVRPISDLWIPEALAVSGVTREQHERFGLPEMEVPYFAEWINATNQNGFPVFWSDNNGYDWSFVNYYLHKYAGGNPFGHSSRRIADLACGLEKRFRSKWKNLRKTKHDHDPLNDAIGNAEALIELCKRNGIPIP